jgi:hypothetical protein
LIQHGPPYFVPQRRREFRVVGLGRLPKNDRLLDREIGGLLTIVRLDRVDAFASERYRSFGRIRRVGHADLAERAEPHRQPAVAEPITNV